MPNTRIAHNSLVINLIGSDANIPRGTISAVGNITGGNLITAGSLSATGNVSGGNLVTTGNIITTGTVVSTMMSATGTIRGGNLAVGSGFVSAGNIISAGPISAESITANSITVTNFSLVNISTIGNITAGNLVTSGNISAQGALRSNSFIQANDFVTRFSNGTITGGTLSAVGNIRGVNLSVTGNSTLGVVSSLSVNGNITTNGIIKSSQPLRLLAGGTITSPNDNYIQLQWASDTNNPDTGKNQYIWADTDGVHINTSNFSVPYDNQWWFKNNGTTEFPGIVQLGSYTVSQIRTIPGTTGQMVSIRDASPRGRLAFWDDTNFRWAWINNNLAV